MEKSADEVAVMEVRTVRRKLTQSTLFPHKAQESSAEKEIQLRREENISEGEDEEWNGSQGRKRRKAKGKATPQPKRAKKVSVKGQKCLNEMVGNQDSPALLGMKSPPKPRPKQQTNTTPKKAMTNGLADQGFTVPSTSPSPSEEKTKCIPDLRLEAKRSAEENSRIFAGKQVHPFFSSRKSSKVIRETIEAEASSCIRDKNNIYESLGPIHVVDLVQDSTPVLDWGCWNFSERSVLHRNHVNKMMDLVEPGSCKNFYKNINANCTSSTTSLANGIFGGHPAGNSSQHPILTDENMEHEMGRIGVCSKNYGHDEYYSDEKNSSIIQIRNHGFDCWNKDVL